MIPHTTQTLDSIVLGISGDKKYNNIVFSSNLLVQHLIKFKEVLKKQYKSNTICFLEQDLKRLTIHLQFFWYYPEQYSLTHVLKSLNYSIKIVIITFILYQLFLKSKLHVFNKWGGLSFISLLLLLCIQSLKSHALIGTAFQWYFVTVRLSIHNSCSSWQ